MFEELNYYFLIIIEIIYISFSLSTFKNKKKEFRKFKYIKKFKIAFIKIKKLN